jgi:hypothetical protein
MRCSRIGGPYEKVSSFSPFLLNLPLLALLSVPQLWHFRSVERQPIPWLCVILEDNSSRPLVLQMFESLLFVLFSDLRVLVSCFSIHLEKKQGCVFVISFPIWFWVISPLLPLCVTWGRIAVSLFLTLFEQTVIISTAPTYACL